MRLSGTGFAQTAKPPNRVPRIAHTASALVLISIDCFMVAIGILRACDYRAAGMPPTLTTLVQRIEFHLTGIVSPPVDPVKGAIVVCPMFDFGGRRVRTDSTITHFGGALDVGLGEVRIEHIFAADADSERFFRESAISGVGM